MARRITELETIANPILDHQNESPFQHNTPSNPNNGTGDFDYLHHWSTQEGDSVIDLTVEEADDNQEVEEDAGSEDAENEDDNPPQVEPPQPGQVSLSTRQIMQEEMVEIINESIETFTNNWKPGKGQNPETDPVRLWEEAEEASQRQELVRRLQGNIKYWENRLDLLAAEICKMSTKSKDEVRKACSKSLEMTVNLIEEAKWHISIYELPPQEQSDECSSEKQTNESPEGQTSKPPPERQANEVPLERQITSYFGRAEQETRDFALALQLQEEEDNGHHLFQEKCRHRENISSEHANEVLVQSATPQLQQRQKLIDLGPEPESSEDENSGKDIILSGSLSGIPSAVPMRTDPILQRSNTLGNKPEEASISTVARWDWNDLVANADRKRIVMKVLYGMEETRREELRARMATVRIHDLAIEVRACTRMLFEHTSKIQGVLPKDLSKIVTFTKIYFCWWFGQNYTEKTPSEEELNDLLNDLEAGLEDLNIFHDWVNHLLQHTFNEEALRTPHAPSQHEIIVLSDDD